MPKKLTAEEEREAKRIARELADKRDCPVRCSGCTSKSCGV